MMTESEYNSFLKTLSELPIRKIDTEPLESLLSSNNEIAMEAIQYRASILSEPDYNRWSGLLCLGIFLQFEAKLRLSCICICTEASTIRHRREIEMSCAKYNEDMPVFSQFKKLTKSLRDDELIDYRDIQRLPMSHCFCVKDVKGFGLIDQRLKMPFLNWLDNKYADKKSFVRINPYMFSINRIPDYIEEAVVNFPDPSWWSKLQIYNKTEKGSSYQLLPDYKDKDNCWDYFVNGIRRLEFHAERRDENNPYLTMIMEELEDHPNGEQPEESYLIGRVIHLDTNAAVGQDFREAELMHIDLAYNYYFGDKREARLTIDISKGDEIERTKIRTHILRIEGIKLIELFPIAFAFFKSQTMVNEWCHYQFLNAEFDAEHRIQQ